MINIKSIGVILIVCLFQLSLRAQAQTGLSESEIAKITTENMKAGKDPFVGILSSFVITYSEMSLKQEQMDDITNRILKIQGVKKCEFKKGSYTVLIDCVKQKDNPLFPTFKAYLAEHNIRIMDSKEILIKS